MLQFHLFWFSVLSLAEEEPDNKEVMSSKCQEENMVTGETVAEGLGDVSRKVIREGGDIWAET